MFDDEFSEINISIENITLPPFFPENFPIVPSPNDKQKNIKSNDIIKAKRIIFQTLVIYVNFLISETFNGKIGYNRWQKKLKKINPSFIRNIKVDDNKKLFNKSLKELFSKEINGKYTLFPKDINAKIIGQLLEDKDEEKRLYFTNLFNKTFLDWLKCLYDPNDKLKEIYEKEFINKSENDITILKYVINHFQEIFESKKARNCRN